MPSDSRNPSPPEHTPESRAPGSRRLVAVLGMHRGGTSVTARALAVLGVDLGDHLAGATPDENAKGFWEDLDIRGVNERLLNHLDCNWDSLWVGAPDPAAPEVQRLADEAAALLERKFSDGPLYGFKDPRFVRLLPFWETVFQRLQLAVSYVIVCRHPRSVAASLARRNGFGETRSLALWLSHMTCALAAIDDRPAAVVDYDLLLEDPETQIQRLSAALALPIDRQALAQFSDDFLEDKLRSTRFTDAALADVPHPIREAHDLLQQLARDRLSPSSPEVAMRLCTIARALHDGSPLFDALQLQASALREALARPDHRDDLAAANITVRSHEAAIASLRAELGHNDTEREWLRAELQSTREILAKRDEGIAWLRAELGRNDAEREWLRTELQSNRERVAQRDEGIAWLRGELDRANHLLHLHDTDLPTMLRALGRALAARFRIRR